MHTQEEKDFITESLEKIIVEANNSNYRLCNIEYDILTKTKDFILTNFYRKGKPHEHTSEGKN
jgi:hypothetical protein